MKVRKIELLGDRIETGPVQFGDDWPGLFIRGDNAAMYANAIHNALEEIDKEGEIIDSVSYGVLRNLLVQLESALQTVKRK
jgi:hypothetical protein